MASVNVSDDHYGGCQENVFPCSVNVSSDILGSKNFPENLHDDSEC